MKKELTPAQQKAKRADEIACRVAFALATLAFIYAAITQR